LILLLTFVGLIVHVKHQSEAAQVLALHSKEVVAVSQSLLAYIAETESAARSYLITDDQASSSPTPVARVSHQADYSITDAGQRQPAPGGAGHQDRAVTSQRMEYLRQVVHFLNAGSKSQAEDIVKGGKGTALMTQVRAEVEAFSGEEDRLDAQRRQVLDTSWQRLSWLLVASTAAAILLASILILMFSGSISRRLKHLQQNAISLAAGQQLAPPLDGHDEIAELDRVFHEMAGSLDELARRERAVIEGTTDAIFVKDLDHRYLMMNQAGADAIAAR